MSSTMTFEIPKTLPKNMQAIQYNKVGDWSLVPNKRVPDPKAHEALIKGAYIPNVGDA